MRLRLRDVNAIVLLGVMEQMSTIGVLGMFVEMVRCEATMEPNSVERLHGCFLPCVG